MGRVWSEKIGRRNILGEGVWEAKSESGKKGEEKYKDDNKETNKEK